MFQQASLLTLLEVVILEDGLQLLGDVSEEVHYLLWCFVCECDCSCTGSLTLPASVGGQPGLAAGADHLTTRRHHQLGRGDGHAHVAMDPRVHVVNFYRKSAKRIYPLIFRLSPNARIDKKQICGRKWWGKNN